MEIVIYIFCFVLGGMLMFYWQKKKWIEISKLLQKRISEIITDTKSSETGKLNDKVLPEELQKVLVQTGTAFDALKLSAKPANSQVNASITPEQFKKTIDNLYIVNELGRKVTSSLNLQQTFHHLYTTINSMMDAAILELYSYDAEAGKWRLFSNFEYAESTASDTYHNHMAEWSISNNREVFLTDAERDFGRYVFQPLLLPDGRSAQSIMIFPIAESGKVTATLSVISFQKNMFGEYHQDIIRLLLGYIAVAMNNSFTHDELNRTKLRAEQSEKFKEQFLANMSHEIRTPINAVTGMTRLLLERQPRQDQLQYLDSIRNASDSLLVIINDILDLSKIEAGKVELEQIDFSVRDVLQNVKDIMQFKAEEKGLALSMTIDDALPEVLVGDPTRLSQVLINLVGNAVKFTEKGSVSIKAFSEGTFSGSADKKGVVIHFSVTDSGIGMTTEQQAKLFMDYAQASADTSRKYGGTGLGLSISRQLVQLQGGTISVSSAPGEGSTFSFSIMYPEGNSTLIASQNRQMAAEQIDALNDIRVLLADDNEYNRIVARETLQLKLKGVHIDEALDGTEAVDLVKQNEYDIVLMDLVMPGMDGIEATRFIRTQLTKPKSSVPILALTASVIRSEIDKCMEAGMNGFVPKPFKPQELLLAMYNVLNNGTSDSFREKTESGSQEVSPYSTIDLTYLNEFTEGDKERLDRFISLFLSKVPGTLETINKAVQDSDFEKVRIAAHSLKPQLRFTGIQQGLDLAEEIEHYCSGTVDMEQLMLMVAKLSEICGKAYIELEEEKNSREIA